MRPKRPRAELIQLLADQRRALEASCEAYDAGKEWEAARLATAIFTLVHDGGSITSLLTQLGLRASLRFLSSGRYEHPEDGAKVLLESPPLVSLRAKDDGTFECIPKFALRRPVVKPVQFETWWAKESVYRAHDVSGELDLTRRRLIFSLRHQDGGGHVGELTDDLYVRLKRGAGWLSGKDLNSLEPLALAAAATMRQVAWEVVETLTGLGEITA